MEYIDRLPAMDLMRSEKMMLVQLIIPVESAHRAVSYLGELGLLQFRDLNDDKSPFQRTFVNQIQLEEHEHGLIEMNANSEKLQQTYNELLEFKMVLQKNHKEISQPRDPLTLGLLTLYNQWTVVQVQLGREAGDFLLSTGSHVSAQETELTENIHVNDDYAETSSLLEQVGSDFQEMLPGPSNQTGVRFISGIICKSKVLRFERMLFRTTRGNMLFNQAPTDDQILDPATNELVEKIVFVVFFSGEQARVKILKICEAFGANCYPVPEDTIRRRQITREVLSHLSDLETTLEAGLRHRDKALISIGFHLAKWMNMVRREKAVYDTLNMLNFDVTKKCLVGEGWCPIFAKTKIQEALQRATTDSNSQVGVIFHVMECQPNHNKCSNVIDAIDSCG
ncbi:UNVERIFIED_CONTAM: V-type proton ATPase subunit a1 [Sesamum radiatum]|uniref:V-type proton ATPase subunit a n=1 Tax=Sesamum radiatum TaxID=300843 RepID=A0AAW2W5E9_SESRA